MTIAIARIEEPENLPAVQNETRKPYYLAVVIAVSTIATLTGIYLVDPLVIPLLASSYVLFCLIKNRARNFSRKKAPTTPATDLTDYLQRLNKGS